MKRILLALLRMPLTRRWAAFCTNRHCWTSHSFQCMPRAVKRVVLLRTCCLQPWRREPRLIRRFSVCDSVCI